MTTPEILPCPWCGGEADVYPCEWTPRAFIVHCENGKCYAKGPRIHGRSQAIARWNAVAAAVQALRGGDVIAKPDNPDEDMIVYVYPLRKEWDAITNPKDKE